MDFLNEDDVCGQQLLRLVSRGNSILAELYRLSDHVPRVFLGPQAVQDPSNYRYLKVLFDFNYLKNPDAFERRLNQDINLLDVDDEFQENHSSIIERFYILFEMIWKYTVDFNEFIDSLLNEEFISHSIDGVLLNQDGRQLMCEGLYLYGTLLLNMDRKITGYARERLVVAYIRYKGESALENIKDVTKLTRHTGFVPGQPRPSKYPEEFFARFPVNKKVVYMVIDRLRSDDVYNMISIYPEPNHRSVALAQQAAMLYVCLYFAPKLLKSKESQMREVVDKHFNDNWIITLYMGHVINLREHWAPYKAAFSALKNTLKLTAVAELAKEHVISFVECEKELMAFLKEGVLIKGFVLDNIEKLLRCLRKCNVAVRWLMLHNRENEKHLAKILHPMLPSKDRILQVLLHTAELEFKLKNMSAEILDEKEERWKDCASQVAERMNELADYFSGTRRLTRIQKDEDLQAWFNRLSKQISGLRYSESNHSKTGRRIQRLLKALKQVEQFEEVDTSLQIKEFLHDSRDYLKQMVRLGQMTDDVMRKMDQITDFSYSWETIDDYIVYLHRIIEKNPKSVVLLRATFKKLTSILDVPLQRIVMAHSEDVGSVAKHYSSELVAFVRRVLEVIPQNVFRILAKLIDLQATQMKTIPTKMEVVKMNTYAQLSERYQLSKYTHQISVFTEGILAMKQTLLGVIQVDPRQILEDGIRKELVAHITMTLHRVLTFVGKKNRAHVTVASVELALNDVARRLAGFKRSFEYIQDYVNMYGLKIWQQEFSRVINYNVEQECNRFLKKKVLDEQSVYQNPAIPVPRYRSPIKDDPNNNFTGRVFSALLQLTDFRLTVYSPENLGWYLLTGHEVVGVSMFSRLNKSLGVIGLIGLDRILSFKIVKDLQKLIAANGKSAGKVVPYLEQAQRELGPVSSIPTIAEKLYAAVDKKLRREFDEQLAVVLSIGQQQLLRRQISNELNFSCQLDSNLLCVALKAMNKSLMLDIRAHYRNPDKHSYPKADNPLLPEISKYLECAGLYDPLKKIYITSEPLPGFVLFLFFFLLHHLPNLEHDSHFGTMVRTDKRNPIDGAPLVVGIVTILKQFHPSYTDKLLSLFGQFVKCTIHSNFKDLRKPSQLSPKAQNVLRFISQFCRFAGIARKSLHAYMPLYIFDVL